MKNAATTTGARKGKPKGRKNTQETKAKRQIKTLTSRSLPGRKGNFSIFFLLIFIEL